MTAPNIIYEVNLDADPGISDEFEAWLGDHMGSMLEQPGFLSATLFSVESSEEGYSSRYSIHYLLESHAAMEHELTKHAADTHRAGTEKFSGKFHISHRVLTEAQASDGPSIGMYCRNCAAPIRGQYCANCGQRSQVRVITMWELTRDMVGDIADLDSRIWRSLIPLLLKPGHLTVDYLKGRRARYMPPFRMYLVLSILFFLLVSVLSDQEFFQVDAGDGAVTLEQARDGLDEAIAKGAANPEAARQLEIARESLARTEEQSSKKEDSRDKQSPDEKCADITIDIGDFSWITQEEIEARATSICKKIVEDNGKSLARGMLENVPRMLFAFLPLIALVLKGLYPLSRRYYVEHLLFVIHFHAFVFLLLILEMPAAKLAEFAGLPTWPLTTLISLYIPYYLFRSMRRVYEQGRLVTLFKYLLLSFSYFFSLVLTFLATLVLTAFTL
jgi:hypothetical protein